MWPPACSGKVELNELSSSPAFALHAGLIVASLQYANPSMLRVPQAE
jgi:hypothetical protein